MGNGICMVDDCPVAAHAHSYCKRHYLRWRRHGDPLGGGPFRMRAAPQERFWAKVNAAGVCWEWTAAIRYGYGAFRVDGRTVLAHRYAWESLVGSIPEGLELDHLCRNPPCVNPDHLEPVTHAENTRRAHTFDLASHNRAKTHCPQGHPYDAANTYTPPGTTWRRCRICRDASVRPRTLERR